LRKPSFPTHTKPLTNQTFRHAETRENTQKHLKTLKNTQKHAKTLNLQLKQSPSQKSNPKQQQRNLQLANQISFLAQPNPNNPRFQSRSLLKQNATNLNKNQNSIKKNHLPKKAVP
jgi:hypothetical protein